MTERQHNQRTQFEIGPLMVPLRKYSFTAPIVNLWNNLPEYVIPADTVNTFTNRLDKF